MSGAACPDADRLFRHDPTWRGADAAYSVPLSGDRTLWLFGDTFLGPQRRGARMIHNTIAIQTGSDPRTAELVPHSRDGEPFFASEPGTWLWPMAGARTASGVVVFFMRVRSARPDLPTVLDAWRAEGSLTFFEVFDWTAGLIVNPDDEVSDWQVRRLPTPPTVNRIMPGAGAFADGEFLYAYGWRDGHELRTGWLRRRPRYRGFWQPRQAFVLRWPVATLAEGLHDPQWWCGTEWTADAGRAVPVVDEPATEFTVHREGDSLVMVQAAAWLAGIDGRPRLRRLRVLKRLPRVGRLLTRVGLLQVSISSRVAPAPEGPWSEPVRHFTPDVPSDVLAYAAKAHPQLEGEVLWCTYAQIAEKADRTLDDESLYYPRFVRLPRHSQA